jgi:hypothetical protein
MREGGAEGEDPVSGARTDLGELAAEQARGNFVRAAAIAAQRGAAEEEVRQLRLEALWQMAAGRNGPGMRRLAQEYGMGMEELRRFLGERSAGAKDAGACYDAATGRYLTFEEWVEANTRGESATRGLRAVPAAVTTR